MLRYTLEHVAWKDSNSRNEADWPCTMESSYKRKIISIKFNIIGTYRTSGNVLALRRVAISNSSDRYESLAYAKCK